MEKPAVEAEADLLMKDDSINAKPTCQQTPRVANCQTEILHSQSETKQQDE